MWSEPSLGYRRMVREKWIIRRWKRAPWFRAWACFQELGRLSRRLPLGHPRSHRGALAADTRYHRCREKRAWRDECQ